MSREPRPDPFGGHPKSASRPPRPIVPAPALNHDDLRGRRVIVGLPGLGWRQDLRADEKVVQGSRTYVPVIPEHEWYKAELEQVEVFAALIPAEQVWVEMIGAVDDVAVRGRHDPSTRLVSLDTPPRRDPVAAGEAVHLTGQRVVQVVEGVERRDLRAVTELYASAGGEYCIRIATEMEWYRWAASGRAPKTREIQVSLLWLE
jgi:hypothetical protein